MKILEQFMISLLIISGICTSSAQSSGEIINSPQLDFDLRQSKLGPGKIVYSWKLMSWNEWTGRPTTGPLMPERSFFEKKKECRKDDKRECKPDEKIFDEADAEVFETHAAAIVSRPVSFFSQAFLHNINTVRILNPLNQQKQIPADQFTVETIVPFPPEWERMVNFGKTVNKLDQKSTPYIRMESTFAYVSQPALDNSAMLKEIVRRLNNTGISPEAINLQSTNEINQIGSFMTVATLFYKIDERTTLVTCFSALALKKHILKKGIESKDLTVTVRSILLGEHPKTFNTSSGIGAGLPKYMSQFYEGMFSAFERK